eukprot:TRINITY_DN3350_c4_g1_i1.p1 TRINITY_DN3350_c4_g1~~TRINITY_DN3350_c4_g1_i1.p1  ORF type:complete len:358 (+),score=70.50 TRINITY_DN3350_c4_g1_i1:79-1152(+)
MDEKKKKKKKAKEDKKKGKKESRTTRSSNKLGTSSNAHSNTTTSTAAMVSIDTIPDDVWLRIFGFMRSADDLCMLSSVSKSFHTIASMNELWKPLAAPNWELGAHSTWKQRYLTWLRLAIRNYIHNTRSAMDRSRLVQDELLLKLLVVGEPGVGKSALVRRYVEDKFPPDDSDSADYKLKMITIGNETAKLQIWDIAGNSKLRTITSSYYRGVSGIYMIYDVTQSDSLTQLENWFAEVDRYTSNSVHYTLIGTKTDKQSEKCVDSTKMMQLAEEHGCMFWETSAMTGENVNEAFMGLAASIISKEFWTVGAAHIPPLSALQRRGIQPTQTPVVLTTTPKVYGVGGGGGGGKDRCVAM